MHLDSVVKKTNVTRFLRLDRDEVRHRLGRVLNVIDLFTHPHHRFRAFPRNRLEKSLAPTQHGFNRVDLDTISTCGVRFRALSCSCYHCHGQTLSSEFFQGSAKLICGGASCKNIIDH